MTVQAPARTDTLLVAEVFGPTIQGEGPSLGRRCSFLRLGACNLACTWCDTPYTWDRSRYDLRTELAPMSVDAILDVIAPHGTRRLVITGGEPLLQQHRPAWVHLLGRASEARIAVEVETNGTKIPAAHTVQAVAQFNVSPKLAHSGDPRSARVVLPALRALVATGKASWKFVARYPDDLDEVQEIVDQADIDPDRVWIMPEGTDGRSLRQHLTQLADPVIARGWNITTRLHTLIWGEERGR